MAVSLLQRKFYTNYTINLFISDCSVIVLIQVTTILLESRSIIFNHPSLTWIVRFSPVYKWWRKRTSAFVQALMVVVEYLSKSFSIIIKKRSCHGGLGSLPPTHIRDFQLAV